MTIGGCNRGMVERGHWKSEAICSVVWNRGLLGRELGFAAIVILLHVSLEGRARDFDTTCRAVQIELLAVVHLLHVLPQIC